MTLYIMRLQGSTRSGGSRVWTDRSEAKTEPVGVHEIRWISDLNRPKWNGDRIPVILFKKVIRLDDLV